MTAKKKPAAKPEKRSVGRPTSYRPEYAEQAYKLCLLGATDDRMADFFGVSKQTINAWKGEFPKFLDSITQGKEKADAEIAESLFHRAKGYSHPDTHVSNFQGQVTLTPLVKYYPPDTPAASLWLRNRQPKLWRDKVEQEISGPDGGPIKTESSVTYTPAEAYQRLLGGGA